MRRLYPWLIALAIALYYLVLLTDGFRHLSRPGGAMDVTFNSMLDHFLQGRFDVDPKVVGMEGFTRDGRVYAYWGPLPAWFRLPLVLVPGWQRINITIWSCFAAVMIALAVKVRTVRVIAAARPEVPRWAVRAAITVLIFSGAQLCFLKASIYEEVCLWAGTFGAIFVAAAIRGWLADDWGPRLPVMSAAAGAALLTRVSVAVGLFGAIGLLMLVLLVRDRRAIRSLVLPVGILAVAVGLTALVNQMRWGNPLTFADYSIYNYNLQYHDRLYRTATYGLFNLGRVPFGLVYYFMPFWVMESADGHLWLEALRNRLIDAAELPPSSFFLTDALLCGWFAIGLVRVLRSPRDRAPILAVLAGLSLSAVLMLAAISMSFRYRIDFYPLLEFGAFVGLATLATGAPTRRPRVVAAAVAISIVSAHLTMALYRAGSFGPAQQYLGKGIIAYYRGRL
jgi:hypothetical protein